LNVEGSADFIPNVSNKGSFALVSVWRNSGREGGAGDAAITTSTSGTDDFVAFLLARFHGTSAADLEWAFDVDADDESWRDLLSAAAFFSEIASACEMGV
jgi:hypothetical protein